MVKFVLRSPCATTDSVNVERDRRLAEGFLFRGMRFLVIGEAKTDITAMAVSATLAKADGFEAEEFRWQNPDRDFAWIAIDNSRLLLDAPSMVEFAKEAGRFSESHVMAARNIKDRILNGEHISDITLDELWP